MSVEIIEKASQTRCYKCGSNKINYICHHCGKGMCDFHRPSIFLPPFETKTNEFNQLGLDNTACHEKPAHCRDCDHIVREPNAAAIVLGILTSIAASILILKNIVIQNTGLIILCSGFLLSVIGVFLYRRRVRIKFDSRPLVPMLPRFDAIAIKEMWNAEISLNKESRYTITTSPATGKIRIPATLTKPDQERLKLYLKKYKLDKSDDLTFSMGFVTFKGPLGFNINGTKRIHTNNGIVIPMEGQVANHTYLTGNSEREGRTWHLEKDFTLLREPDSERLPIRIIPSIIQKSGQRQLKLDVQWDQSVFKTHQSRFYQNKDINDMEDLDDYDDLEDYGDTQTEVETNGDIQEETEDETDDDNEIEAFNQIEYFEIQVPLNWGEVEELDHSGVISRKTLPREDEVVRTITWKNPPIAQEQLENRCCSFIIRFEEKIDLLASISGILTVNFKRLLSRVDAIRLFYPVGIQNNDIAQNAECKVSVRFDLSLAALRYQDIRIVPDQKMEEDKNRPKLLEFPGVIPNHSTIISLVSALINGGFYVQRVIQDPPKGGERINVVNRSWDIAGRFYEEVYPIDFHLMLSGEEKTSPSRKSVGNSKTMMTVQGMYANEEMATLIVNVWENLHYAIKNCLGKLSDSVSSHIPPGSLDDQPTSKVSTDNEHQSQVNQMNLHLQQMSGLLENLDNLHEAFTAAKVFESTYMDVKTRIEKELQTILAGFEKLKNI